MPRCGRLRTFIREYKESPKLEKASFIPPFFILALEVILIIHAIIVQEFYVIILTSFLLIISITEIILVSLEIHEHYTQINFDKILTIRLDEFITETKEKNVRKIVTDFVEKFPGYDAHRNEIYHTTCQVLETHKVEAIEKELENKLKKFIKKKKKANVEDIIRSFVTKFPKYKGYRVEIYEISCKLMATISENDKES
jgi:hypothetical protein